MRRKQALLGLAALLAAGCGGESERERAQTIHGSGFSFAAPSGWSVERGARTVQAVDAGEAVAVTTFRLARPYRAELWPRVVPELDAVANRLARELGGRVSRRETSVVDTRRARVYDLAGARDATRRIGFVLNGRVEYQLLCRWRGDEQTTLASRLTACETLFATFRLT